MNLKEVGKVVSQIKTALFKNSNSYSIGMLKSHFRGSGLQFKEHQIYAPGDDVRFIDWKLLAKTNVPHTKTFEEERNVEITVVLDASPSMLSGYKGVSKLQAAIEITCLLYLLAKETGDYVHVIVMGEKVLKTPKRTGEAGIVQLVSILEDNKILTEDGRVNLEREVNWSEDETERYRELMKHLFRKREVVVLSDFNELISEDLLEKILYKKNIHCFQILSPLDEATKVPYSIYSSSRGDLRAGSLNKVDLSDNFNIPLSLKKRFKKIKVQDRYLESFIKEMI